MSVILSKSTNSSGLFQEKTIVPALTTSVISSIPVSGVVGVKFWITLLDLVNSKVHMSEINVVINGVVPKHTRFAHIGEKINLIIDVVVNAGNIELFATNNETVVINTTVVSETIYG